MAQARVLVVNAGSSSLKLSVLGEGRTPLLARTVERWSGEEDLAPLREVLDEAGTPDVVGHRIVHGGPRFSAPTLVDDDVVAALASFADLAPLHQPRAVAALRMTRRLLPGVPSVACFDTAFHARMPGEAATYALPREWNARFGLRRYGFHGLSHAYAAGRAAELLGRPLDRLRLVTAHLGAGASLAAVVAGRSVDTTMGFTPLAGLVMNTRSGSVDPGMLVWLQRHGGIGLDELEDVLEHRAGLAGLSGTSGDVRDVLAAADAGNPDAALAFRVYVHRLAREVAAMAAATRGVDALVFTGGVGEHAPRARAALCARLDWLGVAIDGIDNAGATPDVDVALPQSPVRVLVVAAREDLEIARQARAVIDRAAAAQAGPQEATSRASSA